MTDRDLRSALERLPVRTKILNVDTGETGEQSVVLPIHLRDALLAALAQPEHAPVDLNGGDKYTGRESELLQRLLDRYSENGGVIPLVDDHPGFMGVIRKWAAQPAESAKGGEVVAWLPIDTAPQDGSPIFVKGRDWGRKDGRIHYNMAVWKNGQWRSADDEELELAFLTDWLCNAHPPAAEPVGLRELRERAAQVADGQVISGNDQWSAGHDAAARKIAHAIRSLPL